MSAARLALIAIPELEPAAIRAAHGRIDAASLDSSQYVHPGSSERLGVPVLIIVTGSNV